MPMEILFRAGGLFGTYAVSGAKGLRTTGEGAVPIFWDSPSLFSCPHLMSIRAAVCTKIQAASEVYLYIFGPNELQFQFQENK